MKILILNHDEVVELLPMNECIALMREALIKLARGEVHQPLRTIVRPPDAAGVMGLMPSYVGGDEAAYGLKTVCIFLGNPAKGKDAHQGAVLLFSAETGELLALMKRRPSRRFARRLFPLSRLTCSREKMLLTSRSSARVCRRVRM